MSAFIPPVLWIKGRVRRITEREVPAVPARSARPEVRDEQGYVVEPAVTAVEGREGYLCYDVVVDTDVEDVDASVGFVEVVLPPQAQEALDGTIPQRGDEVEWPVKAWQQWYGPENRRRTRVAFSLHPDVFVASLVGRAKRRDLAAVGG